ncbi:PHB depolymerase family esterase [Azoarcus sp. KH32C]|uniref:extracellular catalytic domain type 1 short-chain-length polyhydroxyalkanoate depolymerase n=1 Tax=Azoarcus sp. KH32C TaxID=748247 RepID=UPI000238647B|nr:PHB depolymerase family esterase [Azoarcus sp. KH32C]BAL22545.1 esterase / PHB depolymerase family protein [Azoarcus sp. KH32C]
MNARRSKWIGAWFDLARSTARASARVQRAAGKATAKRATPLLKKAATQILTGVASPTQAPSTRAGGRWEEGRWGLGPIAMRRYRLYLPPGLRRPLPLVVLLHGCGQDSASFAATTRAAANARAGRYAVLLPEQAQEANPHRCWNWFGHEHVVATEAAILKTIVDHVCSTHRLRADQVFGLGLSAGGAMALTVALRYPSLFAAVGTHSGAVPHSASSPLQAGQALRGRRQPHHDPLRHRLAGRRLPPLIVIHGDADHGVADTNADASVRLWLELLAPAKAMQARPRQAQRGKRHPYTVTDWKHGGHTQVRLIRVAGLGHAWSGGAAHQAFSDPHGPDALKLAWRFFDAAVKSG